MDPEDRLALNLAKRLARGRLFHQVKFLEKDEASLEELFRCVCVCVSVCLCSPLRAPNPTNPFSDPDQSLSPTLSQSTAGETSGGHTGR